VPTTIDTTGLLFLGGHTRYSLWKSWTCLCSLHTWIYIAHT
jgi:hypothetical protein